MQGQARAGGGAGRASCRGRGRAEGAPAGGTGERRTPAAAGPAGGTAPCSARSIAGAMDRSRGKKKSGAHTCCLVGRGKPNDLEAREEKGETGGGAGVRSVGAWARGAGRGGSKAGRCGYRCLLGQGS